jgi:hypothetical protein
VANANAFSGSTWVVQDVEKAAMFAKHYGKAQVASNAPNPASCSPGDLYNYPEERSMGIVPSFEVNAAQTAKSRAAMED